MKICLLQMVSSFTAAAYVFLSFPLTAMAFPEKAPILPSSQYAADVVISENPDTFCNPIDISYQYQVDKTLTVNPNNGNRVHFTVTDNCRESADPAMVLFKDEYYLFASHGTGYWYSSDLADWQYVYAGEDAAPGLIPDTDNNPSGISDIYRFAPATMVVGDWLYITASQAGSIFKTDNPKDPSRWQFVARPMQWSDPALFYDEELNRAFCYHGSSPNNPLQVVELSLDPATEMQLIGGNIDVYNTDPELYGYQINVDDDGNEKSGRPYLEGVWVTKHDGKYYMEFGVPSTSTGYYADGLAVADHPLGPFVHSDTSPSSFKATGFVRGAGHGSTFKDKQGNWWKISTVSISVNHGFERRLVLYPATHTEHDELVSNMVFADYPMYRSEDSRRTFDQPGPGWNLVSYGGNAQITASSVLGAKDGRNFSPGNAFNENLKNWWSAETGNADEWIMADFKKISSVNAFQVNFADQDISSASASGRDNSFVHRYLLEFSIDGIDWHTLADRSGAVARPKMAEDHSHQYFQLEKPVDIRYIRITNKGPVPAGGKFSVSGIRLFGHGNDTAPDAPAEFAVTRPAPSADDRFAALSWDPVDGAEGYIIRFGTRPDALHTHFQVIGQTSAIIRILNRGADYYFTVDSYNDSGYTRGEVVKFAPSLMPLPNPVSFLRATVNNLYSHTLIAETKLPENVGYNGAYVEGFANGSYAQLLGLRRGDIITEMGGVTVTGVDGLLNLYSQAEYDDDILLTVWRQGRYVSIGFVKDESNLSINVPCLIGAETYDDIFRSTNQNMGPESCGDIGGGQNIGNINGGAWLKYDRINFSASPEYLIIRAARPSSVYSNSTTVQVRLDNPSSGPIIASVSVSPTAGWQVYDSFRADITEQIDGIRDVYIVFVNGGLNLNWFSFNTTDDAGDVVPDYELARFSQAERTYLSSQNSSGFLLANWTVKDGTAPVDLTGSDRSKLFMQFTIEFAVSKNQLDPIAHADVITNLNNRISNNTLWSDGGIRFGSGNNNWVGWRPNEFQFTNGKNIVNIPLSAFLSGEGLHIGTINGTDRTLNPQDNGAGNPVDWQRVDRIFFQILRPGYDFNSQISAGLLDFSMTLSDIRIVDTTSEEMLNSELDRLSGMLNSTIPKGNHTNESYNAYLQAIEFARQEITFADILNPYSIEDIQIAIATLERAILGLAEKTGLIKGNPTGSGEVSVADILFARDFIFRRLPEIDKDSPEFAAMDMNNDGIIDIFDLIRIRDAILRK
ncbi:MAG: carbohydrate-binding protein [Oscillospiraceae bacterium]|nr:carbohydrate-binding protein [Oscillospiraceae bacterium]